MIGSRENEGKTRVLWVAFFIGLALLAYSWWTSYPISLQSSNDLVFYHIPLLYWFSLALTITAMYLLAVKTRSTLLGLSLAIGIILIFFSLSFFFNLLPGSDSPYFRGFMDYFIKTDSLDTSQVNHGYFQWPAFFILTKTAVTISGLSLFNIEFFQFALIGSLIVVSLFLYSSKFWKNKNPVPIIVFFIIGTVFLNYQDVPFSLAITLFFIIILILENRPRTYPVLIATLILFTSISLTHLFVPLFYVLYLLIMLVLKRSKQYGLLFISTIVIYLSVQLSLSMRSLEFYFKSIFAWQSDFSLVVNRTLTPTTIPLDNIIQVFTRTVTLSFIAISLIAFILFLRKRRLRSSDKAIFMTGLIYSAVGVALYTLGTRAVPLIFIPACLGAYYFFGHKNGRGLQILFIVLLIFSISIPIHTTLSNSSIMFQTEEGYTAANFMMKTYNWTEYKTVLLDTCTLWYITPQIDSNTTLINAYSPYYQSNLNNYDCIVNSVSLQSELQGANVTATELSTAYRDYSAIYNSGNFVIYESKIV